MAFDIAEGAPYDLYGAIGLGVGGTGKTQISGGAQN